jgi:hypothetical protein
MDGRGMDQAGAERRTRRLAKVGRPNWQPLSTNILIEIDYLAQSSRVST